MKQWSLHLVRLFVYRSYKQHASYLLRQKRKTNLIGDDFLKVLAIFDMLNFSIGVGQNFNHTRVQTRLTHVLSVGF